MLSKHLEKDKHFYLGILAIIFPVMLQSALGFGVTMLNSIMLGALGEVPMAASHLGNQVFNLFSSITAGFVGGCCVLVSQYWGKGDLSVIRRVMAFTMKLLTAFALVFSMIGILFPTWFLGLYSNDAKVIALGAEYVRIISVSFVFFGISFTYLMSVRATENARLVLITNLVSYGLNIFFNYVFIYGKLGFPVLGVKGVAIGTLVSRLVEFSIVMVHMNCIDKRILFRLKHLLGKTKAAIRTDFFKYALPIVIHEFVWGFGNSMHSLVLGRLGAEVTSAQSIVDIVMQLGMLLTSALVAASGILIGKAIGAGEKEGVFHKANSFLLMSVLSGVVSGIVFFVIKQPLLLLYPNVGEQTHEMVIKMMNICAIYAPIQAVEVVCALGILRGGGDGTFVMIQDGLIMWLVCIPLGALAAFVLGAPASVVYFVLRFDLCLKGVICGVRVLRRKWVKKVTREESAIGSQSALQ